MFWSLPPTTLSALPTLNRKPTSRDLGLLELPKNLRRKNTFPIARKRSGFNSLTCVFFWFFLRGAWSSDRGPHLEGQRFLRLVSGHPGRWLLKLQEPQGSLLRSPRPSRFSPQCAAGMRGAWGSEMWALPGIGQK